MSDEKVNVEVEVEPEGEPAGESAADVEAARAHASAEAAAEAAQIAITQAEATTADVAAIAADELQAYQGRLLSCEEALSTNSARLAQLEASQAEAMEHLSSIRSRLETAPEPEPSHLEEPHSENAADPVEPEPEGPGEPEKPERKRAHRWI